jgi:hypothetical protein
MSSNVGKTGSGQQAVVSTQTKIDFNQQTQVDKFDKNKALY